MKEGKYNTENFRYPVVHLSQIAPRFSPFLPLKNFLKEKGGGILSVALLLFVYYLNSLFFLRLRVVGKGYRLVPLTAHIFFEKLTFCFNNLFFQNNPPLLRSRMVAPVCSPTSSPSATIPHKRTFVP